MVSFVDFLAKHGGFYAAQTKGFPGNVVHLKIRSNSQ
jgi:hypothetical protein